MVLLPSVTRGLVLVHGPALSPILALAAAARQARTPWLLPVDPAVDDLSASGIAELLVQLNTADFELALPAGVVDAEPGRTRRLAATARLGLLAAVRPALATAAADQARPEFLRSLAHLAARRKGWAVVDEPWPALA